MSFRAVVASSSARLSASEDRVVSILLGGLDMSQATAAEVAEKAQTHESTVVRLAQKLGYRGYPELRNDLRRDEGSAVNGAALMRSQSGYHLDEFIRDEVAAFNALPRFVSQEDLDAAARTLHSTQTVYLISSNDERPTLELLARRLRRLGLTVVSLRPSPKDLAERFVSLQRHQHVDRLRAAGGPHATLDTGRRSGASRRQDHPDHRCSGVPVPAQPRSPARGTAGRRQRVPHPADPDRPVLRPAAGGLSPRP